MTLTVASEFDAVLDEPFIDRRRSTETPDPCPDLNVVIAQTTPSRVDAIKLSPLRCPVRGDFVISRMLRRRPDHGMTEPHFRADGYAVCVHLTGFNDYDIWCNNQHYSSRALGAGTIHISDMRQEWRADIRSPFHVVNFYLPQAALDDLSNEQGASQIEELKCPISLGQSDDIFRNLVFVLLPALDKPDEMSRLFADHASRTITAHLAKTYGSGQLRLQRGRGGLAPWQERRAKEMLTANLSGNLGLSELARACRLSPSHFSQAFRQTVGSPPHRWLLNQRVERAKQLLLNTDQPLCEIALATGFADQSHFTRVFSERIKASPAAWRRAKKR